jgi:hypothetical protein
MALSHRTRAGPSDNPSRQGAKPYGGDAVSTAAPFTSARLSLARE